MGYVLRESLDHFIIAPSIRDSGPQKHKISPVGDFMLLCLGRESNPHALRREILSLLCIPFHHPGDEVTINHFCEEGNQEY